MKKIVIALGLVALSFSLLGCHHSKRAESTEDSARIDFIEVKGGG